MCCGFPVRLTKEGRKSTPTLTNHKHPLALIIALIAEELLLLLNQTISCVTAGRRLARCPEARACDVRASWRPEPVAPFEANGALLWQPREQTSPMACTYRCYGNRSKASESHKLLPPGWSRHRFRADHHLLREGDNITRLSRSANEILCPFARRQMPDGEKKKG